MSNAASLLTLEADETRALRARIAKLERINAALMDRGGTFDRPAGQRLTMFETAISLEAMVRDRTSVIEDAMARLATVNAELADAHAGQMRRARDFATRSNRSSKDLLSSMPMTGSSCATMPISACGPRLPTTSTKI